MPVPSFSSPSRPLLPTTTTTLLLTLLLLLLLLFPAPITTSAIATTSIASPTPYPLPAGQNLTTHLLTTHAAAYAQTLNAPAFFRQVRDGSVAPGRVAYFFGQDVLYGRGFTALAGAALELVVGSGEEEQVELNAPREGLVLEVVDGWGETASGLADEGGRLVKEREGILGALKRGGEDVACPSVGTREYVQFMRGVSYWGRADGFGGLVCAWVMGKAFIDIWTAIQADQLYHPNKIPQLQSMIDYWADPSYVAAVDATAELVDRWFATVQEDVGVADEVFVETLERETAFWESVDAWNEEYKC